MSGTTLSAVLTGTTTTLTAAVAAVTTTFQVDFAAAKTGVVYRIQIKLFNQAGGGGQQVGTTRTIDVADTNTVDDIRGFFKASMTNLDLTCDFPAGNSKKAVITGPEAGASAFGSLMYKTQKLQGGEWVDFNYAGPSYSGREGAAEFWVNGTKLGP